MKENPVGIFAVNAYRAVAYLILYGVLGSVLCYAGIMGFYVVNSSWIAPIVLSETDKDTLDLTEKLVTTEALIENLKLDVAHLQASLLEYQQHRLALLKIQPELTTAIKREQAHNVATGPELSSLTDKKHGDISKSQTVVTQLAEVDAIVDKELALGLITKADAVQIRNQFTKSSSELTDSQIGAVLLKDNILEKSGPSPAMLDALDKKAELASQINVLDVNITTSEKQILVEVDQIARLEKAVAVVRDTPFYTAITGGDVTVALVPYDNQSSAVSGAPIYDCYLSVIACRRVGTVGKLYAGEQHAVHPIFRTDLRGALIQLNLTHVESAKSKTLFIGHKPLLF